MFKEYILRIFTIISLVCITSPLEAMFSAGFKSFERQFSHGKLRFDRRKMLESHGLPYNAEAKYTAPEDEEYESILFPCSDSEQKKDGVNNNNNNNKVKEHDLELMPLLQQFFAHCSEIDTIVNPTINQECLETQDKLLGFLVNKLLDPEDTTPYKTIVVLFEQCPKIQEQYPEFSQLINEHSEYAQPKKFIDQFNELKDTQLPIHVLNEKKNIQPKIKEMGWIEFGKYAYNIYGKFS